MNILQAMLDSSSELIVLLSKDHKVLARNKAAVKFLLLYFPGFLNIGDDYRDFVIPQNMSLYLQTFDRALQGETIILENETVSETAKHWFRYKMCPLLDGSDLLGIAFTAGSIELQKRAELSLQYLADTHEAIVQNTTEAIALLDSGMYVLQYNQFATQQLLLNFGREIQIGDQFLDYVYPDLQKEFQNAFKHVLSGMNWEKEYQTSNIKNEKVWIRVRMYPVRNNNGETVGVALFVLNILNIRNTELLTQAQANTLKDISWQHSHLIRAPLANVLGIIQVLKDQKGMPEQEQQDWLSSLFECATLLDETIKSVVSKTYEVNFKSPKVNETP